MVISLRRSIRFLILVAVLLTPVFNIGEVVALLQGTVGFGVGGYTPTSIKAIKDLLLLLIAALGLLSFVVSGRTNRLAVPFVVLLLYVGAVVLLALAVDPRLPAAGLRWILPVFLIFLLVRHVDEGLLRRIARILVPLLVVHFAAQLLQLLFMSNWYGVTFFGLAARVPGIFFMPNSAGFFSVMCLYFAVFHLPLGKSRRMACIVAPASVFLTQSGTGLIVLLAFTLLLVLGVRKAVLLLPAGPLLGIAMLFLLPLLTGRGGDYVAISGGTRLSIFADLFSKGEWLPRAFGFATNTAVALSSGGSAGTAGGGSIIADSTYASVLGNLGLLGIFMLLALGIGWGVILLRDQRLDLYAATLIFSLYGFTIIIMEAFPMSLFLAVLGAYYCRTAALRRPEMRFAAAVPPP